MNGFIILIDTTIYLLKGYQYNAMFTLLQSIRDMQIQPDGLIDELDDIIQIERDNTENGTNVDDDGISIRVPFNNHFNELDNLYISDASFMPTGGSVPYTWTIYANSFRVADIIKKNIQN